MHDKIGHGAVGIKEKRLFNSVMGYSFEIFFAELEMSLLRFMLLIMLLCRSLISCLASAVTSELPSRKCGIKLLSH